MSHSTTENDTSRKPLVPPEQQRPKFDERLSVFGRIAVDADRQMGKPPRFHDGMTLEDALILTGLPREEAGRRIRAMKTDSNPKLYAEHWLSEGAGERYLAEQAVQAVAVTATEAEPKQPDSHNPPEKTKAIQRSLYIPDQARPVSNDMARSALFSCIQPKDRQFFYLVKIGSFGDAEMFWTGVQLDQDDHDNLMQLIKCAEHRPWGEYITLPWRGLLGELGRTAGGKQQKELSSSVQRLVRGTIDFKSKIFNYTGHLVDDIKEDQQNKHLIYRLNPSLSSFYDEARFTLVDWNNRKKLRGKYLARWLQLELATHAAPFPRSVKYYLENSGSRATLKAFRRQLRIALGELIENGDILPSSYIDPKTDLVHIHRTPSAAQIRHITRAGNGGSEIEQHPSGAVTRTASTIHHAPPLKPATVEKFRTLYPGFDPYGCKAYFDTFLEGKEAPRSYDAAFLGYAKKWAANQR